MVLRARKRQDIDAVADDDKTRLLTLQEPLDDDFLPGAAEGMAREHIAGRADGLLGGLSDYHALTRREAVGLNDQRERLGSNVRAGGVEMRKRCVRRRGYAVAVHKGLRIDFGALKRGRRPARAKAPQPRLLEAVHDPGHQRRLRSDQGEVDASALGEGEERREIVGRDGDVFSLGFARRACTRPRWKTSS